MSASVDSPAASRARIPLGGITLDVATWGAGPMLLFLHGFPECGQAWQRVAERLANDHLCVVPDQRGYGRSDRPEDDQAYRVDALLGDIDALVDRYAPAKLTLIGHDWGGLLAWWYAGSRPEKVDRLIVANAPHPAIFQRALLNDAKQRAASHYIAAFREPGAEHRLMAEGPETFWDMTFGRLDPAHAPDRAAYIDAWSQPGAVRAMLAWYRESPFVLDGEEPAWVGTFPAIAAPTLVLWGMEDGALLPALLDPLPDWVPDLEIVRFAGAGHSLIHQDPEAVAGHIRRFAE